MPTLTIYHNPRCLKSRQTLSILEEHNVDTQIILYLETPLKPSTLKTLVKQLSLTPNDLMRKSEAIYKSLSLKNNNLSDKELIDIMLKHPKLIERPIVTNGSKAVIGRPHENVLELINL